MPVEHTYTEDTIEVDSIHLRSDTIEIDGVHLRSVTLKVHVISIILVQIW